ncbi:uncharacterized protein LOC123511335 [Portunus trituberculatus]|uniref:uncharacterized protein LOC123511335 n=1 Tax=Portunus trituberculatus TaxID=210409 RepID=UPI001E1CEDD7|nr:uncharacterized protein LOC123511335 [Portunus trituberculatus]
MATSTKIPWTRTSEASLLELVRQKRFLWDHKDALYSKTKVKQTAFDAIAKELWEEYTELSQLNGVDVRIKFKNLRTYFMNVYNKMKNAPSGSEGCPGRPWQLFDSASFLIDSLLEKTPTVATYVIPPADTIFTIEGDGCLIADPDVQPLGSESCGSWSQGSNECRGFPSGSSTSNIPEIGSHESSGACSLSLMETPLKRKKAHAQGRSVKRKEDKDPVMDILQNIGGYMEKRNKVDKVDVAIEHIVETAIQSLPIEAKLEFIPRVLNLIKEMKREISAGENNSI